VNWPIEDIITVDSWEQLCKSSYHDAEKYFRNGVVPPPGTLFCSLDHIDELFQLIRESGTTNRYVIVSARSDYGLHYQSQHPVWYDMVKALDAYVDWPTIGYKDLPAVKSRREDNTRETDKYSVKVFTYTRYTFDKIPDNVAAWFCTNVDVTEPKIQAIPFGVSETKELLQVQQEDIPKQNLAYANWVSYNKERVDLITSLNHYKLPWVTIEENVSRREFLRSIKSHSFVLCPSSNGLDTYRLWETIYLGSIPVIIKARWNENWHSLPVLRLNSWNDLSEQTLKEYLEKNKPIVDARPSFWAAQARLSYWRNCINAAARQIVHI
jgi:hypothetical protein